MHSQGHTDQGVNYSDFAGVLCVIAKSFRET